MPLFYLTLNTSITGFFLFLLKFPFLLLFFLLNIDFSALAIGLTFLTETNVCYWDLYIFCVVTSLRIIF